MSSIDVQGNNNRTAGRDYYEGGKWDLHIYPTLQRPPAEHAKEPSLEQLLAEREEAKLNARRTWLRRYLNGPFIVLFSSLILAAVAVFWMANNLGNYVDASWIFVVPVFLLVFPSLYWNRTLATTRAIREAAINAERHLANLDMEIARRREWARIKKRH